MTAQQAAALCLLVLFSCLAHAAPVEVDADIIWDDSDARGKCPRVCSAKSLYWTGTWRKTGWAATYLCSCDDKAPPPPVAPAAQRPQVLPGFPIPAPAGPPAAAGMPTPVPGGVVRYDATDFFGSDLHDVASSSFEQCAGQCLARADCRAFTFASDQNRCYLKTGAGNARQAPAAVSGVIASRAGAPPTGLPAAPAQGSSCSVGGTPKCPGCSVSCPPGQTAHCENGVEGVASWCARNASCRCS